MVWFNGWRRRRDDQAPSRWKRPLLLERLEQRDGPAKNTGNVGRATGPGPGERSPNLDCQGAAGWRLGLHGPGGRRFGLG